VRFLVDGYNLLWVFPPLRRQMIARNSAAARKGLVGLLAGLVRSGAVKGPLSIVFDGRAQPGSSALSVPGVVEVRFAPHPATADSLIVEIVQTADAPGEYTVVSSDREVQTKARRLGAAVLGAKSFIDRYVPERTPRRRAPPEDDKGAEKPSAALGAFEVDAWLQEFGLADEADQTA
jgi:predicted RNA-binding protein with PIN domain